MKVVTKKGYDFFVVTSAFQKAIRRGDETVAVYLLVELFNSGYEKYLWKRLKIISSEDIGLAVPNMPAIIQALYTSYQETMKDSETTAKEGMSSRPERMFLLHAVLLLTRCKKSRLVDWVLIEAWRTHDENHMKIPDYAYDMHNFKGKQMNRGIDHFYDEGTLLGNFCEQPGEKEWKEKARTAHKTKPGKLKFAVVKKANISQQQVMFEPEEDAK